MTIYERLSYNGFHSFTHPFAWGKIEKSITYMLRQMKLELLTITRANSSRNHST